MANYNVKLTPPSKPNNFGTAHLTVATKLKRITVPFPVSAKTLLASIFSALEANAQKSFKVSIGDEDVDVRGFDGKLGRSKFEWKGAPPAPLPGRHKLIVHVVEGRDVDDDGESSVEFNFEIEAPEEVADSAYEVDEMGLDIDSQLLKKIEEIAASGPKLGGLETLQGIKVMHHTIKASNKAVFYNWEGNTLKVRGVGRHTGKDGQNDQYTVSWYTDGREFTWTRK